MEQMRGNSFLFLQIAEYTKEKKYLNASEDPVLGAYTDKNHRLLLWKTLLFTACSLALSEKDVAPPDSQGLFSRFPACLVPHLSYTIETLLTLNAFLWHWLADL